MYHVSQPSETTVLLRSSSFFLRFLSLNLLLQSKGACQDVGFPEYDFFA